MSFADDLLLFARGDKVSVRQLMNAFEQFSSASGLKANQSKSCIYFGGVSSQQQEDILSAFGMEKGELPFRYLGVPLSSKKLSVLQCQPLISRVVARIECWSSKFLSYAGRIQLIKSVIFGIQAYWLQVFLIPHKVIKVIQSICRIFLWTGKADASRRALVAWDQICKPKLAGGWSLVDLQIWNKAAICKLLWCLAQKKDKIWVKWVHGYYIKGQSIDALSVPSQASWVLKKVMEAWKYIKKFDRLISLMQESNYSIKKVYEEMRGDVQRVTWNKMLCKNVAPPRCIFIGWLAMMGKLVTCDRLHRIGIHVDLKCILCDIEDESMEHLFFRCAFSRQVWKALMQICGVRRDADGWTLERERLISQCKSNTNRQMMYRLITTVLIYGLWRERNMRKFQGIFASIESVVAYCQTYVALSCRKKPKLVMFLIQT